MNAPTLRFFALCALFASLGCAKGGGDVLGSGDAAPADDVMTPPDDLPEDVSRDDMPPPPDAAPEDAGDDAPVPPPDVVADDATPPPPDTTPTCGEAQMVCTGACVSVLTDNTNCGACGNACAAGTVCMSGACRSTCAESQTACPAAGGAVRCANLQSDGANCGSCGNACPAGQTCASGRCATSCPAGQAVCAGGSCADLSADTANCGRCGVTCIMGQSCAAGACACPAGQTACGSTCVSTATDATNCGRCGNVCGASQRCAAGACACPSGQTLCGGACVDTATSSADCGACGNACGPGQRCAAGRCACPAGQTLCGGRCVDTATDGGNCGACGTACPAAQSCAAGRCQCPSGTSACGARCANLQSDNANCGACGTTCPAGNSCSAGRCACACAAGLSCCGAACNNLQTDARNCGMCAHACAAGETCAAGACRPGNDARTSATAVTLAAGEVTVAGTTANATFDGPTDCTSVGPNVWYRVTLALREVLYADTAGSAYDTRLYLANASGATVAGTCNDDASCSTGGFTSTLQSRFAAVVDPGTYYVAVSGFSATATGAFTLHLQHVPANYGSYFYDAPITGTANTTSTLLVGASARAPTCISGGSGEDARWFVTCGSATPSVFSLCASDGGSYVRASGTATYDPSMYVYAGQTGTQVQCNDDGPSTLNCRGTGGDTSNWGPRISAAIPRGIHAVVVDERLAASGMTYVLHHEIH